MAWPRARGASVVFSSEQLASGRGFAVTDVGRDRDDEHRPSMSSYPRTRGPAPKHALRLSAACQSVAKHLYRLVCLNLDSDLQRSLSFGISDRQVGALLDEDLEDLRVTVLCGQHRGRPAVAVDCVWVGALGQQCTHDLNAVDRDGW